VITFAYPTKVIGRVWRDLRTRIGRCPLVSETQDELGVRAITTFTLRGSGPRSVGIDIRTRSRTGAAVKARVVIYQRTGNAIQKIQVSRRSITRAERAFATRVARVSRAKYAKALAEPVGRRPVAGGVGDVDGAIQGALAGVPPGATVNVAIGDSMASGESGRWRGNVVWHANWAQSDAYGDQAYWDTPTGESIPGCHRAKGAEIHVPGTYAVNLACSGALTTSIWSTRVLDYGQYKPGIDDGAQHPSTGTRMPGQMTLLSQVARRARIGTILMSIGGNDMGFGEVMTACIADFMRPWPFERRCHDNPEVTQRLSDASLASVEGKVAAAIVRVHATMAAAGYPTGSWQMIIQGFPRLIADDARYPDTYAGRLLQGGCPVHSEDVAWLNARLPMISTMRGAARRATAATGQPVRVMDITKVFAGRELCARGAAHVDQIPPGEVIARAERVQMARALPPFGPTEGMHPNQIGQQALQACLREAMNGGAARSGRCDAPLDWARVDSTGLPLVRFTPEPG